MRKDNIVFTYVLLCNFTLSSVYAYEYMESREGMGEWYNEKNLHEV